MITKCSLLRVARLSTSRQLACKKSLSRVPRRHYASVPPHASPESTYGSFSSSSAAAVFGAAQEHPLSGLVKQLDGVAPRFEVDAGDVEVLRGPAEFYEALKSKILKAKRRIYLSTLYIGKTEHELISTIRTALQQNPDLKISFLIDALRGTREAPKPSCASLLAPLITEFGPQRVEVRMYHTPNLTGLRKRYIPARINEGWGLQHMKLYGVDDEIIMSGANLSSDYFTNRLDRYHVFRSAALTGYYSLIYNAICSISFSVQPSTTPSGFELTWPSSNPGPSPLSNPKAYITHASALLGPLIVPSSSQKVLHQPSTTTATTLVYPLFQLTPLFPPTTTTMNTTTNKSTELPALTLLLTTLQTPSFANSRVTFTAGYFNPTPSLTSLLLSSLTPPQQPQSNSQNPQQKQQTQKSLPQPTALTIIAASPQANGFYNSPGISGLLPAAYTLLCRRFLEAAERRNLGDRVNLLEWRRGTVGEEGGWTYHAKGLWVTLPSSTENTEQKNPSENIGPHITLIGSSNYTLRSNTLDLEANALVVTTDEGLRRRLKEEEEWLRRDARRVEGVGEYERVERRVGWHVRAAMWVVKVVGGAL